MSHDHGDDADDADDAAPDAADTVTTAVTQTHDHDAPPPVEPDDGPTLPSSARAFFDWVVVVGVALLVAILVRTFLLAHFVVDGQSMNSTLSPGDRVFVNKMSYRLHDPGRGDVVVLHEISGGTDRDLIKRVVALPGEQVTMENCVVYIDTDPTDGVPAQRLDEPYLDPTVVTPGNCGASIPPTIIGEREVFVMGDNRPGSHDSRAIGPIEYDELVGRAFVIFWPKADWAWL